MGVGRNGNLIPPKKGEVRNPKGKPVGLQNSKTRYLRLLALTEKIQNPVTGKIEEFSVLEQLDMQMIAKARKGDLNAYKEIMDRLEGRPSQSIEHTGKDDGPIESITSVTYMPKPLPDDFFRNPADNSNK